jgi:hypothetical protein
MQIGLISRFDFEYCGWLQYDHLEHLSNRTYLVIHSMHADAVINYALSKK